MSDEQKAVEQSYHYQVDQQVSVNAFIDVDVNGETAKFQITSRYGSTPEKIIRTTKAAIEAFATLRQEYPRQFPQPAQPAPKPQEVTRQPIDDSGNDLPEVLTAAAGRLSWEVHDGKTSYKVMDAVFPAGARGTKYGITVWPEVLKAAGLSIENGQPVPNIAGWTVKYICNDKGYPQKVTGLFPPKA